jgi:hypothetical protein
MSILTPGIISELSASHTKDKEPFLSIINSFTDGSRQWFICWTFGSFGPGKTAAQMTFI